MWQDQVDINRHFDHLSKIGDSFTYQEVIYQISGIGHTHIICSNISHDGDDLFLSKKDFLKKFKGVNYENKTILCL